jgi:hypothetical protein
MKRLVVPLFCLGMAAPALAQTTPPPAPYSGMFTPWSGTSRESLRAEAEARRTPPAGAVPATAEHNAQVALGERVADAVRRGDCAEGERLAREAADFPLVRAVRDYCRQGPPSAS